MSKVGFGKYGSFINNIEYNPYIYNGYAWGEIDTNIYSTITDKYLYNRGIDLSILTGGWVLNGGFGSGYSNYGSLSYQSGYMEVYITPHGSEFLRCKNKIDVTNYKTISLSFSRGGGGGQDICICISNSLNKGTWVFTDMVAVSYAGSLTSGTLTIDVSNVVGEYYLGVGMAVNYDQSATSFFIYDILLST